jgi:hypothetical protein
MKTSKWKKRFSKKSRSQLIKHIKYLDEYCAMQYTDMAGMAELYENELKEVEDRLADEIEAKERARNIYKFYKSGHLDETTLDEKAKNLYLLINQVESVPEDWDENLKDVWMERYLTISGAKFN